MIVYLLLFVVFLSLNNPCSCNSLSLHERRSVFLIPGTWSSTVYANITNNPIYRKCMDKDYIRLWMEPDYLANDTKFICMTKLLQLPFDNTENVTFNIGKNIEDIEYLGENRRFEYFSRIINILRNKGYPRIHSLAYDFRFIPKDMKTNIFPDWENRIRQEYNETQQRLALVCHSMGCKILLHFFIYLGEGFIQNHIESVHMMAGALGGSTTSIRTMIEGNDFNYNLGVLKKELLRRLSIKLPSTYFLLPKVAINEDDLYKILETYVPDFDKNLYDSYAKYEELDFDDLKKYFHSVQTYCMFGSGLPTKRWPDQNGNFQIGLGDGVVNIESLELCRKLTLRAFVMYGDDHMGIILGRKSLLRFSELFNP